MWKKVTSKKGKRVHHTKINKDIAQISMGATFDNITGILLFSNTIGFKFFISINSWWRCRESNPGPKYF